MADGCKSIDVPKTVTCSRPYINDQRTARVADLLSDFRTLQYYIAATPTDPSNVDDYYTEGYAALRQCSLDGQHILNCAAETRVPRVRGGADEQSKAELQQYVSPFHQILRDITITSFMMFVKLISRRVLLDAFSRRHEAQKIYLRQGAAQRWISYRDQVLQGERPHTGHTDRLNACDVQLRAELVSITDEAIYSDLRSSDYSMGRWTQEDPSLRHVQRWVRARR
ncbi:hypothetical protein DSL72_006587 [Monilinia vaccinii-corymbosi]|uniref:Uncharacterized protein n=1 Tax=Monilinia vaccinii-corymbosi TaxID=61207 RepID=A0A8A3PP60_9HELO|nr:hypothetical protein DSL72_006587 [Monilinia vaccinii-corymbosi]